MNETIAVGDVVCLKSEYAYVDNGNNFTIKHRPFCAMTVNAIEKIEAQTLAECKYFSDGYIYTERVNVQALKKLVIEKLNKEME